MQRRIGFSLVLAISIISMALISCTPAASQENLNETKAAPDFTLQDLNGQEVSLSQFKGKAVLIVFWASWCPPCRKEIPELKEIYHKYKDDKVKLLAINVQESPKKVTSFAKSQDIPYTTLLDRDGQVARKYGVQGIPYMVITDKTGAIYYEGHRPHSGLMPVLAKLLE